MLVEAQFVRTILEIIGYNIDYWCMLFVYLGIIIRAMSAIESLE